MMYPYRLADKAAMRILAISKAIRGGVGKLPPAGPTLEELPPATDTRPPPAADATGAAPLNETGADMGTIAQGGDMFDALAKGL